MRVAKTYEICQVCGMRAAEHLRGPRQLAIRRGVRVTIEDDEFYRCYRCGETYQPVELARQTEAKLQALRQELADLLRPEQIRAIREKYGLSQAQMEKLMGLGAKHLVKWEQGTAVPNRAADTLLRVMDRFPAVVMYLAKERHLRLKKPARAQG